MYDQPENDDVVNKNRWNELFASLPGGKIVNEGLVDLERGVNSVPAFLVLIARTHLQRLGVTVPQGQSNPEHNLYDLLSEQDSDSAHSKYNALIRLLVSFQRALACVKK